jgi:hypothetical protein
LSGAEIEDGESAVRICGEFQVICGVGTGRVGDEFQSSVVRRTGFFRKVELPESG